MRPPRPPTRVAADESVVILENPQCRGQPGFEQGAPAGRLP